MKRIHFPYPLLILLIGIIWLFLIGENSDLVYVLVLFLAFLLVWFINTSMWDTPFGEEWEDNLHYIVYSSVYILHSEEA